VLVLAGAYRLTGEMVLTAKVLGVASLILGAFLVFRIARQLTEVRALPLWAATLTALSPHLIWGAVSGMEVGLYVFLTLLGVDWHLRYRDQAGARSYLSTVAFALAALARPECYLLFAFALVDHVVLAYGRRCTYGWLRAAGRILSHVALYTLILLPNWAFNFATIRSPFPTTFHAKVKGGLLDQLADGNLVAAASATALNAFAYMHQFTAFLAEVNLFLLLPAAFGLVGLAVAPLRSDPAPARSWLLPLTFAVYPFCVGAVFVARQFGGVVTRYISNLVPLYILLAVIGSDYLARFIASQSGDHERLRRLGPAIARATLVLALVYTLAAQPESAIRHGGMVENINHLQVALGRWAAANLPAGSVIALNDIGAIPYFSGHRIIDTVGLATPQIVPYIDAAASRDAGVHRYLSETRPDYVIIFPDWYPVLATSPSLEELHAVTLARPIAVTSPRMVIYRATWR
jgi:hypothetical protein